MKTAHAIQLAGNAKALAELLGITPGAVSQWGTDIPQAREWQLRSIRPGWFVEPEAPESGHTSEPGASTNLEAEPQGQA